MSIMPKFGKVYSLRDGIANIAGLANIKSGELLVDVNNNLGMALNLENTNIGVVMFTEQDLKAGSLIFRTYKLAAIVASFYIVSNVLSPFGQLLNKGFSYIFNKIKSSLFHIFYALGFPERLVEVKAPGILVRQSIYESVNTGVKVVDGMIPLGQGQRELIIGDRQTGKTAVALDSMLNQGPTRLYM
jgi:F-type H+-transporting ATPase subunit alpha